MQNWRIKNLVGQTFTRWTVLSSDYSKNTYGYVLWLCQCECGIQREISTQNLRSKSSMSCGCLTRDKAKLGLSRLGKKGQKHTEDTKIRIAYSLLNNYKKRQESLQWKLSSRKDRSSYAHAKWSRNVKIRDGWKCKIHNHDCSGRLESHHILGWAEYPELRFLLNNGITLCAFHHPSKKVDETRLSPYFQKLVGKAS